MSNTAQSHDFGDADELFHEPTLEGDWTETSYWGFHVPERKLTVQVYNLWRVRQDIVMSCVWIWDDTGGTPFESIYSRPLWHIRIPENRDPTNFELPSGLKCERLGAFKAHRLTYTHPEAGVSFDVVAEGITEPHNTFSHHRHPGTGHFDQSTRVRGTLTIRGEEIAVDSISMRDRTWGSRPEITEMPMPICAGYAHGGEVGGDAFLFYAVGHGPDMLEGRIQNIASPEAGFLLRDGEQAPIMSGSRTILSRKNGRPVTMRIEAQDALGRDLILDGVCQNHFFTPLSANIPCLFSMTKWTKPDGGVIWGENQECWLPSHTFREHLEKYG